MTEKHVIEGKLATLYSNKRQMWGYLKIDGMWLERWFDNVLGESVATHYLSDVEAWAGRVRITVERLEVVDEAVEGSDLTHEEIDALGGQELSEAVGHALPWLTVERLLGLNVPWWGWRRGDIVMGRSEWHPHKDANQALEVWAALVGIDDSAMLHMAHTHASIEILTMGEWRSFPVGTFCEAICRAYLKARQGEGE